ncbi:putative serine protease PepD [Motilibacter peucedani]|uniref:Putative serine protease PepD n=1 Tax=Motilibacter peucedani TaxID=598650 RepID=A0A420XM80_9ACTN|nr:trypsin-like peptidase domain-containing protein [Motilibacter peucedani]RKS72466.1 putative serine protease PepD [Motilibacter peucedani]
MSDERPEGAWWAQPGDDPWAVRQPEEIRSDDWPTGPVEGTGQQQPYAPQQPQQPYAQQQPYGQQPQQPPPGWGGQQAAYPPVDPYFRPPGEQLRRPGDAPFSSPYAPPYTSPHFPPPPQQPRDVLVAAEGRPARSSRRAPLIVALAALIALLGGAVGGVIGWGLADDGGDDVVTGTSSLPVTPRGSQQRPQGSVPAVAAQLLQRVVSIQVEQGSGSGFVIRPDGYILTNNHVVASAIGGGEVRVVFQDGRGFDARIVGADSSYDLAVIKVDASALPTVAFGDSAAAVVGDPVIAVGSPLGLSGTVTTGIVSALDRPVTAGESGASGGCGAKDASYYSAIQTDAAINPGNSGGPLVNYSGQVIGVNSAISTLSSSSSGGQSGSIGLGFAIPSNQAKRIADEIIRTGHAVHPVIGVSLDCTYDDPGARIGDARTTGGTPGVEPGGPADKAGLREGDVITAVDGKRVADSQELIVAIRAHVPGETVSLAYTRGGRSRTVEVTLGRSKTG